MARGTTARQEMGCGYEPPSAFALPWRHPGMERPADVGADAPWPTVCAGYTTKLPEVQEIAWAHWHSQLQTWRDVIGPRAAPAHLIAGIEIYAIECAAAQRWEMRPKEQR